MSRALEGKVALITGGSSGIGRAVALRYREEGAKVGVLARGAEKLDALRAEYPEIRTFEGDVRDASVHQRAVAALLAEFGQLDILVANAGVYDWNTRLIDLPDDPGPVFDELFAINVKGYLLAAKAAARALAETSGAIIFTLSNAALYVDGGGPLYTASRHATLGLMRQIAFELAPRVRVNGVAIGGLKTDLRGTEALGHASISIAMMPLDVAAPLVMPISRQPEVEEAVGPYVFLADARASSTVTGAVIEAHGGVGVRGYLKPAGGYDLDPAGDRTAQARAQLEAIMGAANGPRAKHDT